MNKPILTIMQGLPGSGKTHRARKIAEATGAIVASSDTFPGLYGERQADGSIPFNMDLLGAAHGRSLRDAIEALQRGDDVVIDNTNTDVLEIAPYVALAQALDAEPKILRINCDPDVAFERNTHRVPRHVFDGMADRLRSFGPEPHWQFVPGFEITEVDRG